MTPFTLVILTLILLPLLLALFSRSREEGGLQSEAPIRLSSIRRGVPEADL